ncbi:hypothetical protein ACHQM5_023012 [Ranunculus cassubicifolius]
MAASSIPVAEPVHEIPSWLKTLPLAPEYHPTLSEFEDPISYILKIEKEASRYGICKIVPPVSLPSKKTTIVLGSLSHLQLNQKMGREREVQKQQQPIYTVEELISLNPYNPEILPDLENYVNEHVLFINHICNKFELFRCKIELFIMFDITVL